MFMFMFIEMGTGIRLKLFADVLNPRIFEGHKGLQKPIKKASGLNRRLLGLCKPWVFAG